MTYRVTKIMDLLLILYDYCDYYISYVAINIFFLVWSFKKLYIKRNKKWERERESQALIVNMKNENGQARNNLINYAKVLGQFVLGLKWIIVKALAT